MSIEESRGSEALHARAVRAVKRGIEFLHERQLPSGEFPVLASSDVSMREHCRPDPSVFPTALIAHSLSFVKSNSMLRAHAVDFLLAQMDENGLWRHWTRDHPHFRQLPPDLDDTSCASAVLTAAGKRIPHNRGLLLDNRDARGLFFTWITPRSHWTGAKHMKVTLAQLRHPLMLYLFFKRTSAKPRDIDAVVNANCLFYLQEFPERQRVIDHLLNVLRSGTEGSCDKWYENPFVIWYFYARALCDIAPDARPLLEQRLAIAKPSNTLELALVLCTHFYCKHPPSDMGITQLIDAQLESGAWPRAALYHGGRARRLDGSFALAHPDTPHWGAEELTTGFCIEALSQWT